MEMYKNIFFDLSIEILFLPVSKCMEMYKNIPPPLSIEILSLPFCLFCDAKRLIWVLLNKTFQKNQCIYYIFYFHIICIFVVVCFCR